MEWMIMPLKRYADFSGRSRRKEYWMFALFTILVNIGFVTLMFVAGGGAMFAAMSGREPNPAGVMAAGGAIGIIYLLSVIFSLAILIPSIAVGVRRLHDTNRRGWWLLAPLAPYVVMIVLGLGVAGSLASGNASNGAAATLAIAFGVCGLAVFVLGIVLIVFMCLDGTRGPNRFGPDPKDPGGDLESVFS
jgi:uncharacterized membrane protein YhaH (DUF805 family)